MKKTFILLATMLVMSMGHGYSLELKQNDRIVFVGNSLTHAGSYHSILRSYLATRYHKNVVVFNKGVSGDVAKGMIDRLENDILMEKPTVAFVMAGMNDVCRNNYCEHPTAKQCQWRVAAMENYKNKMEVLTQKLLEHKIKTVLLTPTMFEESELVKSENHVGVNAALGQCADYVKYLGNKYNLEVVDLHTVLNKLNSIEQKKEPEFTIIGKDRVHPGELGHLIMAYQIVKTVFGDRPIVSDIGIDVKGAKVVKQVNAKVDKVQVEKGMVEFDVLNQSLPMALVAYEKRAQKMFPVCQEMNKEQLAVKALEAGRYRLTIDDVRVGVFSKKELEKGVRLDKIAHTPQYVQAREIARMSKKIKEMENLMRDVKFVDYKLLNTDLEGKPAKERLKICKEHLYTLEHGKTPCNPYFVKMLNSYINNVEKLDTYKKEIKELEKKINLSSIPVKRHYVLKKI